jgi:small-conductance mechanosensitive channel
MQPWILLGVEVPAWAYLPTFYTIWVVLGLLAKAFLLGRLTAVAGRTGAWFLGLLARALSVPLVLLVLFSGLVALVHWTPAGTQLQARMNPNTILVVTSIAAGVLFADSLLRGLLLHYADRVEVLKTAGGLLQGLVRGLLITIGLLMLLDTFGISITPILASIGIGSLAVALALQPTLESFFAGVQLVTDRPIRVGDFIRLESGEEGYVDKIGWRTTWIRMLPNNMLIIPNKQLVGSRLLNYYYPSRELSLVIPVGVHYASDLAKVERVTVEVAEEIQRRVPGTVPDHKPFVRFHTMGSSSIDFSVILRAQEFNDTFLMKHAFIKALLARYAQEGIVIPFPITAINLSQERAAPALPVAAGTAAPTDPPAPTA